MSKNKYDTVEGLAKLTGKGADEALLLLWENGVDDVLDVNEKLVGRKLIQVRNILHVPSATQLTSLAYWQRVLQLDEEGVRKLLLQMGLVMSDKARKLPVGAVKKLKAETQRRKLVLLATLKNDEELSVVRKSSGGLVKKTNDIRKNLELHASDDNSERIDTEILTTPVEWFTIGKKDIPISSVSIDEILTIHYALVKDFTGNFDPIDPAGPRDRNLIESAIYRLETSVANKSKYESVEMKGAALLHSMIHNHPFHNGNKRTALVTLLVFLDKNQQMLICSQGELFKFVLSVAQHRIVKEKHFDLADREVLEIAQWIYNNSRSVRVGDKVFPFRKIRQILNRYNCFLSHSDSGTNYKVIRKIGGGGLLQRPKVLITNFAVKNEGHDLQIRTIKKIRLDLELDEDHGIDSEAFYNDGPTSVDEFIVTYRKTLTRLAKL